MWPQQDLEGMLNGLLHRGPDDRGMHVEPGLFIGHTRLAVIDLSSAGHQPMYSEDRRFIISYNGEIYNFKEIRKELETKGHHFVSQSDTEVLITAWQLWGEACVEKLDGIFAFALFDAREKTLWLVRDHLGVKPLFYTIHNEQVFFASELLALFGPLNPCPEVKDEDIDTYFTFNYLPAPLTGLKGVNQLSAGCLLKVNSNGCVLRRYWKPAYHADIEPWSNELTENFEALLDASVKNQLISDAPLGLFLSGGLDSFAVALAAVAAGQNPTAYTLGFAEANFDEIPAALQYSQYLKIKNDKSYFSWTEEDVYEALGAMKELLADASCFPTYQLSKYARKKFTVALAGDGGDELLAGYDTYKADSLMPYIRMVPSSIRSALYKIAGFLPSDNHRYGLRMIAERLLDSAAEGHGRDHASFRRIFNPRMKKRLYDPGFFQMSAQLDPLNEYAKYMGEVPKQRSYLTACQHADMMFHLPSILAKVDRMSMANSLEVRVPILSRQLMDFCINLPDEAKLYRGKSKRILREAIARRAPREMFSRPKAGFLPPVDQWFQKNGPMNNVFGDYLAGAKASLAYLQWDEVEKLWVEHRRGAVQAGFILLGILQFINWELHCRKKSFKLSHGINNT